MEFRLNYVVVGCFVLILTACTLAAGLWLSAGFQNKSYDIYEILMYEPVSGLNEQAPVKFNGVQVGYVQSISLNARNPRQVILLVDIEHGTPITKSTVAMLMTQGITGVTYIGLKAKTPHADSLKKLPGQTYPIIPSSPSLLVELDTAVRELSGNLDDISASLKTLLSTENIQIFHDLLSHTNNVIKNIDHHAASINHIFHNTDIVMQNLAKSSVDFHQTLLSFNQAATETTQFLSESKYALRQWSTQVVPSTYSLVTQLARLTSDFQQIANELKQQPSLLIREKGSLPLGPGEH